MKKYWKINAGPDLRQSLEYINIHKDYIDIIMDDNSRLIDYIKNGGNFFYIAYDDKKLINGWGWVDGKHSQWYINSGFKFCGEINLRKSKLIKLNKIKNEYT